MKISCREKIIDWFWHPAAFSVTVAELTFLNWEKAKLHDRRKLYNKQRRDFGGHAVILLPSFMGLHQSLIAAREVLKELQP